MCKGFQNKVLRGHRALLLITSSGVFTQSKSMSAPDPGNELGKDSRKNIRAVAIVDQDLTGCYFTY